MSRRAAAPPAGMRDLAEVVAVYQTVSGKMS